MWTTVLYSHSLIHVSCWYHSQIPVLNIQMKMIPAICTFLGAIFSCTNYFRVIFTGGVGKNGSTIAVSPDSRCCGFVMILSGMEVESEGETTLWMFNCWLSNLMCLGVNGNVFLNIQVLFRFLYLYLYFCKTVTSNVCWQVPHQWIRSSVELVASWFQFLRDVYQIR